MTLAFFWAMAIIVFLQFFTRYALNNSIAWTEEIARYLLMCVGFLGGGLAVRRYSHIHVEFLYVYMPDRMARALSPVVDVIRVLVLCLRHDPVLAGDQDHAHPTHGGH